MDLLEIYHHEIPDFLREAAQTPVMQRLKGVGMNCGCEYTAFPLFSHWQSYSRFDHCLGTGLITWHFTGDPHQAMAALLHDVATPVFSHVVDFLRGDYLTQESTEDGTKEMILESRQLMEVCKKYAITPELITDYHRYPIADNDSPKLSADRLEYTLGNIVNFGFGDRETVKTYYEDLCVQEDELVFVHEDIACAFARDALRCGKIYVSDEDRYAMQILAELLKEAVAKGIVTQADLYRQEKDVIETLQNSCLASGWCDFCNLRKVIRTDIPDETGRKIFAKKRYVDPMTNCGSRASELDNEFSAERKAFQNYSFDYYLNAVK